MMGHIIRQVDAGSPGSDGASPYQRRRRPIGTAFHEGSHHAAGRHGKPRFGRSLTLPTTRTSTIEEDEEDKSDYIRKKK
jgi:hypothetical protein